MYFLIAILIQFAIKRIPQIDAKLADHTYMIISVVGLVQLSVNLQLGLGVVVLGPIVGPIVGPLVGPVVGPAVFSVDGPVVGSLVGFVQLSVKVQRGHGVVVGPGNGPEVGPGNGPVIGPAFVAAIRQIVKTKEVAILAIFD